MEFKKTSLLGAFLLAFFIGVVVNFYNIKVIKTANPSNITDNARSLKYNKTIYSIDDYWYLPQIKNFINGNGFTYDTSSTLNMVRRTPIYPMFYGVHYVLFGEKGSHAAIRWTQLFLFALSAVFLLLAAFNFTKNKKIAWLTYLLYLLYFPLIAFVFYTITEALYPSLMCFMLYGISRCKIIGKKRDYFITGILAALCILTRPAIVFILPAIVVLILIYKQYEIKKFTVATLLFISGLAVVFSPWVIRNYIVTKGDIVVLEKFYDGDQMDYGMPNMHLKSWVSCWVNPANFSSERVSNKLIEALVFHDSVQVEHVIDSIIQTMPPPAYIGNSDSSIRGALRNLAFFYRASKRDLLPASITKPRETVATNSFLQLEDNFKNAPKGKQYIYFFTPLQYLKSLIFQSNASSLAFLDNYNGNPLKLLIKIMLLGINIFSFASIFLILIWYKKYKDIFWLAFIFSGLTYLIIMVINKNFESRYIFPLVPILYITTSAVLVEVYLFIKRKLNF